MDARERYESKPWLRFYPPGVPENLEIERISIPQALDRAVERYGDKPALIFYGKRMSFRVLREQADRFAAALASLGVGKGGTVGLYLLNSPQFAIHLECIDQS